VLNDLPNELPLGGIEHDRDVRSALHALALSPRWLGA